MSNYTEIGSGRFSIYSRDGKRFRLSGTETVGHYENSVGMWEDWVELAHSIIHENSNRKFSLPPRDMRKECEKVSEILTEWNGSYYKG